ncbi:MAG: FtsB family cell division protein [bacterium]
MKSNKEKRPDIKFTAGAIFVFLFASIIFFSLKGMVKVYRLRSEQRKLNEDITSIKKNNKKISRQIYELNYNKQYIANLAREKLNMIKPGEIVFKFIGKGKKDKNTDKTGEK